MTHAPPNAHAVAAPKTGPVRTCVGCGRRDAAGELVPLAMTGDGVTVTLAGARPSGRGAHVHARPQCVADAAKKGLARSARRAVRITPATLRARALDAAKALAADSLTRAANGGAIAASGPGLHVVAANAAATSEETRAAVREGRALCFGTRRELGGLLGVEEADLAVVTSEALGWRLRRAAAVHTALAGSEVG